MKGPTDALSAPPPDFTVIPESSQRGVAAAAAKHEGHSEVEPLDVRIVPLVFLVTYWCGLTLVYAFMAYVIAMSATWRGPVIVWALLVPTAAFSLWRLLPSERRLVETKSAEVILLRCGGFYALAGSDSACGHADGMPEAQPRHRQPSARLADACTTDGGATADTIVARL